MRNFLSLLCAAGAAVGFVVHPAQAGKYTPIAGAMVRSAVPSVEAYRYDNGTYVGMTVAKLRAIDSTLSSVEIVGAKRNSYCIQANVLGSWAHFRSSSRNLAAGRC